MSKNWYALVKWIGGEDDKKYTPGIPLEWILGFDYEAYMADDHDISESYVVEWCDPKKRPKGGWNCYDCHVVLVSDKIKKLHNHLQILEGAKSPRVVNSENSSRNEQNSTSAKNATASKNKSPPPTSHESEDDEGEDVIVQKKNPHKRQLDYDSDEPREKNKAGPSQSGAVARTKNSQRDFGNDDSQNENAVSDVDDSLWSPAKTKSDETSGSNGQNQLNTQKKRITKEPTLTDIMNELKQNNVAIKTLRSDFEKFKQDKSNDPPVRRPTYDRISGQSYKNVRDLDDGEFFEGNVEIGPPGSGILVTDMQWTSAISKGTYKAMATTLITSLFSTDVLLKSNFKGGESKLKKKDASCPKYVALDAKAVQAVMYSVRAVYPKTFTEVGVGQAINVKLTNLRAKNASPEANDDSA